MEDLKSRCHKDQEVQDSGRAQDPRLQNQKPLLTVPSVQEISSNGSALSEDAGKHLEKVKVLHVESPASIYIRAAGLEEKYLQMRAVLQKFSSSTSSENLHPEEIRVNSSVICYRATSARWERGLVMSEDSHSGTLTVRLTDIGKIVSTARSDVRLSGPEVESFGTLTQCISLSDIEPAGAVGDSWSLESVHVLRDLIDQKIVLVRKMEGGERAVELFYERISISGPTEPQRRSLVSVARSLIRKGLAYQKGTIVTCFNLGVRESHLQSVLAEAKPELKMITRQTHTRKAEEETKGKEEEDEEDSSSDPDSESYSYLSSSLSPPSPSHIRRLPAEPVVPSSRVFRARLTHIDSKGTIWVVPKETSALEKEVRRLIKVSTISCPRYSCRVGDLVVMRKNLCRGRIIHQDCGEVVTLLDIDSGKKHSASWSLLSLPTSALVERPPLALPLKLYGVKKTLAELTELKDLHYDEVTVISLALHPQRFPLPANIRLANKNQSNSVGGNLALDLIEKGFFQLIKNQEDWTREFFDHGLDSELDPKKKFVKQSEGQPEYWSIALKRTKEIELLNMKSLPHPLPLSEGQWLSVQVEDLVEDLKDGTESEPSVETRHGIQVWCSLWPITDSDVEEEVAASALVINNGLKTLQREFLEFEEELMFKIISAERPTDVSTGQEVLAYYQEGEDIAWSRAVINHIKEDGSLVVTYTDYGYRGNVARDNVRAITLEQRMEPCNVRKLHFKMPRGNQELREIRNAFWNSTVVLARVDEIKISEEEEEVQVSFWEKRKGADGHLTRIC